MLRTGRNSPTGIPAPKSFAKAKSPTPEDDGLDASAKQNNYENELKALRNSHELEVQELKEQLAQYQQEQENGGGGVAAHEKLQARVEELSAQLAAKEEQALIDEEIVEELSQKLEALESENPDAETISDLTAQTRRLEFDNQTLREELEQVKEANSAINNGADAANTEELKHTITRLQKQLEEAKTDQEKASEEHEEAMAKVKEEHATELSNLKAQHDEDLELLDHESQLLQKQLEEEQLKALDNIGDGNILATSNAETNAQHEAEIEALRAQIKALEEEQANNNNNNNNNNNAENEAPPEIVEALQAQVKALRDEHANEMTEILAQLDLVEAEHAEQLRQLKSADNQQQDVMVGALSKEVTTKTGQLQQTELRLQQAGQQLHEAQQAALQWEQKYHQSQQIFESALEEEQQRTLQAADEARQEMIQQAESQFENANQMYMKLKQEYATALDAKNLMEEELEATQADMEELQTRVTQQQAEYQRQLDALQQDFDKVQDIAVTDKNHFHGELDRFQKVHDGLIQQLEQAAEAHRTLERTLTMLVMEKETMAKENLELKGVCEETMAVLESYESQGR